MHVSFNTPESVLQPRRFSLFVSPGSSYGSQVNALSPMLELAPALVVLPGPRAAICDGAGARDLDAADAPGALSWARSAPAVVVHASLTARRLELQAPPRSRDIFDALELFAFV